MYRTMIFSAYLITTLTASEKAMADTVMKPQKIEVGQYCSPNELFVLAWQPDGHLVLYDRTNNAGMRPLWASGTAGRGKECWLQSDGHLVIYDDQRRPIWTSNTAGHHNATLRVQDDGNLVIVNAANQAVWNSGTCRGPLRDVNAGDKIIRVPSGYDVQVASVSNLSSGGKVRWVIIFLVKEVAKKAGQSPPERRGDRDRPDRPGQPGQGPSLSGNEKSPRGTEPRPGELRPGTVPK